MNAGELNVHFINSVLATVIVAFFVLWRYRQAILGGMMRGDPVALPLPEAMAQPRADEWRGGDLAGRERALRRRLAAAWLLTTAICSLPMALAYMYVADMGVSPTYALGLTFCYMFAALPMIAVSLAWPTSRLVGAFLVMLGACALLFLLAGMIERLLAGRSLSWRILGLIPLFGEMAWIQLWMAGVFWLLSWPVRLRGVVPITLAALLVFGFAPFIGSRLSAALAARSMASSTGIGCSAMSVTSATFSRAVSEGMRL